MFFPASSPEVQGMGFVLSFAEHICLFAANNSLINGAVSCIFSIWR